MNRLSNFANLYEVASSNFCYYNAKSSSCHLKRSDVWLNVIWGIITAFLLGVSLFCAVNVSLLLGGLTLLLGGSFSYLVFLVKLFVTGELSGEYSKCKQQIQEEIDYKISAEICKAKSKIYGCLLFNLNKIFADGDCAISDCLEKGKLQYSGNRVIDLRFDEFRKNCRHYSLKKLEDEQKFIENRLEMLYKELEIAVCRKVMYKKLKIRLNCYGSDSFGFGPKNLENHEVFKRLVFGLSSKYNVCDYSLTRNYPLDLLQAVSRINSIIREIVLLEIEKVLVERLLPDDYEVSSLKPVIFSPIASARGLKAVTPTAGLVGACMRRLLKLKGQY